MYDLRWIRENREEFDRGLTRRGLPPCAEKILALDRSWRAAETSAQRAQARRNEYSKQIAGEKQRGRPIEDILQSIKNQQRLENLHTADSRRLRAEIDEILAGLPNLPAEDVPDGPDETANRVLRHYGEAPRFDFAPLSHEAIGERLGMMDFARAGKLSGARFVVLRGGLARLERALGQFMLDLHTTEFGYTEVSPPLLVRDAALFGTSQLPKFAEDQFRTTDGYWLIPTAEVPLTNLVAGEILDESTLPKRYTAWTPCFRSEAGASGKDTRGMIRQHQFEKVELVSVTRPEESAAEHERMTNCAEEVLKRLGLAYRVVLLSTGDMGFAAQKTYDLEVWLPGQGTYREISSCSNCGAFQARRMKARYRPISLSHPVSASGPRTVSVSGSASGAQAVSVSRSGSLPPVHTLNGSGLAIGRTLIAILENFQRHNGAVAIPSALQAYMGGQEVIEPCG
jgi:seryl-tRNA synthetase